MSFPPKQTHIMTSICTVNNRTFGKPQFWDEEKRQYKIVDAKEGLFDFRLTRLSMPLPYPGERLSLSRRNGTTTYDCVVGFCFLANKYTLGDLEWPTGSRNCGRVRLDRFTPLTSPRPAVVLSGIVSVPVSVPVAPRVTPRVVVPVAPRVTPRVVAERPPRAEQEPEEERGEIVVVPPEEDEKS